MSLNLTLTVKKFRTHTSTMTPLTIYWCLNVNIKTEISNIGKLILPKVSEIHLN